MAENNARYCQEDLFPSFCFHTSILVDCVYETNTDRQTQTEDDA
jgi:hypothetical protein